jgi:S1-C subfamily serine protease
VGVRAQDEEGPIDPPGDRAKECAAMTRRSFLALAVVAPGAALLSACTGGAGTSSAPTTSTAPPAVVVGNVGPRPAPAPGTGDVAALQAAFLDVVARVRPEVVEVATKSDLGSGVVYDNRGDIVTNNHVVGSATSFEVQTVTGGTLPATLVGTYPRGDLAVIRVTSPVDLRPATFGDSAQLAPGSIVFAVGSPLGLASSVTQGIVSYNGRPVDEGNGVDLPATIQTSASINPGNSGGALVDLDGAVVGIPTLAAVAAEGGGQAGGIGFAIPSDSVRPIADQLIATGHVSNSGQAVMAIEGSDAVDPSGNPVGVVIGNVPSGSGVAKAGISRGDVVTALAGRPTPTLAELENVVAGLHSGSTVTADVVTPTGRNEHVSIVLDQLGD